MSSTNITLTMKKKIRRWFRLLEELLNTYSGTRKQKKVKVRVSVQDKLRKIPYNQVRTMYNGERL